MRITSYEQKEEQAMGRHQEVIDALKGRVNGALVGLDGEESLEVLEEAKAHINRLIDEIVDELNGDEEDTDQADQANNEEE